MYYLSITYKPQCSYWCIELKRCESNSPTLFVHLFLNVTGRMDVDISLVEDCRRLAKQCKMEGLIEQLENKCKQLYEFGKAVLLVHVYTAGT